MFINHDRTQQSVSSLDLMAPEIQNFSDRRDLQGRPNHMLRWVTAIAAVLVIGHLVFQPAELGTRPSRMQPKEHLPWWCADASSPDCQPPARSRTTSPTAAGRAQNAAHSAISRRRFSIRSPR